MPAAGPAFYARVFHPAFNIDTEDAEDALDRFDIHIKTVGRGVQGIRNIFGRVREARVGKSVFFFISEVILIMKKRCPRLNAC
jgi:sorting nexin-9/18/33